MIRKCCFCALICVLLLFTACKGNVANETIDGQHLTDGKVECSQTEGKEMEDEIDTVSPSQSSPQMIGDLEEKTPIEDDNSLENIETVSPTETTDQTQENESEGEIPVEDKPIEDDLVTSMPTDTDNTEENEDMNTNYKLIVAGQNITNGNYFHVNEGSSASYMADLPLLAVAKCYGADVTWKSTSVAEITLNESIYTLNLSDVSFTREGSNFNCIIPVPGGRVYHQVIGSELILDDKTLCTVLRVMGINAQVRVDYQSNTVTIQ